jgi:itaconate CoA-transferase
MLPLAGITVLALEHAIAAPFCTRQLADLGARVIKIERPGSGDFARAYDERAKGLASHFVWTNRSKESVTLDVKHPQAAEVLAKLVAKADVLVQNLAPGAAARLGLSYEAVRERNPRLVYCSITGFGQSGPYSELPGYDPIFQAMSGLMSITGVPDGQPGMASSLFWLIPLSSDSICVVRAPVAARKLRFCSCSIVLVARTSSISVRAPQLAPRPMRIGTRAAVNTALPR